MLIKTDDVSIEKELINNLHSLGFDNDIYNDKNFDDEYGSSKVLILIILN